MSTWPMNDNRSDHRYRVRVWRKKFRKLTLWTTIGHEMYLCTFVMALDNYISIYFIVFF